MKAFAKAVLRTAAFIFGPHRWRRGPRLLVLTYHRILPLDHPDRATEQPGMLVTPELLEMHFRTLKRYFTPVHLDDWLASARKGSPSPGQSLAITFDDGWRDNYDYAFPVIKAEQMPVTLFVVTDMIGSSYQFWPNRLARALRRWRPTYAELLEGATRRHLATLGVPLDISGESTTPEMIDGVIVACKKAGDADMHALMDEVEAMIPDSLGDVGAERDLLDWKEIREMADSELVRFGSHTRRHTRLREELTDAHLLDEVAGSRQVLEEHLGRPAPLFCYPNGDWSLRAYESVKTFYDGAASTRHGWHSPAADPYVIKRIGVHGDVGRSPTALLARVSGWPGL